MYAGSSLLKEASSLLPPLGFHVEEKHQPCRLMLAHNIGPRRDARENISISLGCLAVVSGRQVPPVPVYERPQGSIFGFAYLSVY